MEQKQLRICIIRADEAGLDTIHVNELSDEEFLKLASEKHLVLTLTDFVEAYNRDTLSISSENTYIRVI